MNRGAGLWLCAALLAAPLAASPLPSGLEPELKEVLLEQIGPETWARFRFEVPELHPTHAARRHFADVVDDFGVLCDGLVLSYLADYQIAADRIVISFSDREVEFGASDPEATQFFEQFRIADGACIWEGI